MGVTNTNSYDGPFFPNGVTTSFPFTFKALDPAEVVLCNESGTPIDVAFSVALSPTDDGGSVIFTIAPTAAAIPAFLIVSAPAFGVKVDLGSTSNFSPRSLNPSFDRLSVQNIFLKAMADRSLRLPLGEAGFDLPPAAERDGNTLGFAAGGLALVPQGSAIGEAIESWTLIAAGGETGMNCPGSAGKIIRLTKIGVELEEDIHYTRSGDLLIFSIPAEEGDRFYAEAVGGNVLMLSAKASGVSFSQEQQAPFGSVARKLQQIRNPLDDPHDAIGDGITNDAVKIVEADAKGPLMISGNHRISNNITITRPLQFIGNGRLTIDAGATITFGDGAEIDAPRGKQIFYGEGTVAGLNECWLEWFIGDHRKLVFAANPTTNVRNLIQKAVNATLDGGLIRCGPGVWLVDGTAGIVFGGQSFEGAGRSKTVFLWPTNQVNGFHFLGEQSSGDYRDRGGNIRGFAFKTRDLTTIPAAGTAVLVSQGDRSLEDIHLENPYMGIDYTRNGGGGSTHMTCGMNGNAPTSPSRISAAGMASMAGRPMAAAASSSTTWLSARKPILSAARSRAAINSAASITSALRPISRICASPVWSMSACFWSLMMRAGPLAMSTWSSTISMRNSRPRKITTRTATLPSS